MAVEELFQWGELFKFPVRPLQDGFIGIIQPVTLTFGYGIQSLRIELAVVDGDIRIDGTGDLNACLLYTSPSPRDRQKSRMPSSA